MTADALTTPIARHIWETKYRWHGEHGNGDRRPDDTWRRVARALAAVEPRDRSAWEERFYHSLAQLRFLPGGRILAGAGTGRRVTLFNCFVMGLIEDSMDGIFEALKEGALTMQQGGGVGYDFSTLRPAGSRARRGGTIASGPVSFMRIWDSMCETLISTGNRRGAMMGVLRCDHPDIETFIDAKRDGHELRQFNLSVLVTDDFLQAVREDRDWPLLFPAAQLDGTTGHGETLPRAWSGQREAVPCRVLRRVSARALWERLLRASYDVAEPGVLFIDRINRLDNLAYRERISATNPCGEIPLPPYGACDLGSLNLPRFVRQPFTPRARLDLAAIEAETRLAVRLLDNVIDASHFPLPRQQAQAQGSRRIGLGITGLADALLMLGMAYGEAAARDTAADLMRRICHTAYRTSCELAREKGVFPFFEREPYLRGEFIRRLPAELRRQIAEQGLRNSHLTAIAPTGTISLLANNVSSGLEPVFDFHVQRRIRQADGSYRTFAVEDYAHALWRRQGGKAGQGAALPAAFVSARELPPEAHLGMQAALQPHVDNAIAKTINIPGDYPFDAYRSIFEQAYALGLKGCTTFRPNPVTGAILSRETAEAAPVHCCDIDREPA